MAYVAWAVILEVEWCVISSERCWPLWNSLPIRPGCDDESHGFWSLLLIVSLSLLSSWKCYSFWWGIMVQSAGKGINVRTRTPPVSATLSRYMTCDMIQLKRSVSKSELFINLHWSQEQSLVHLKCSVNAEWIKVPLFVRHGWLFKGNQNKTVVYPQQICLIKYITKYEVSQEFLI